jgi:hypothetical protein
VYAVQDESLGLQRMQARVALEGAPRGGGGTSERMSAAAKDGEPQREARNEWGGRGHEDGAAMCLHMAAPHLGCGVGACADPA